MLNDLRHHEKYVKFVKMWIDIIYPQGPPKIHARVATMLMLVDLTPMRKIIEQRLGLSECRLQQAALSIVL